MALFFVAVGGLVVGSFLNAVLYRLSVGDSVFRGRSYCPHCKHELGVSDLVPLVSYLVLRGRCRYCKKGIALRYPLVEAATAAAFMGVYARYLQRPDGLTTWFDVVSVSVFTAYLIVIFVYDLLHYLILDVVVIPAIAVAAVINLIRGHSVTAMLIGATVCGGFFAAQFFISRGKWIGGGDIRLGLFMGVLLSWPLVLVALAIAYIAGSIIGIGLIAFGTKTMESKVPFGTFLTVAAYVTLLYGNAISEWYLGLL